MSTRGHKREVGPGRSAGGAEPDYDDDEDDDWGDLGGERDDLTDVPGGVRLQKVLAAAGVGSRRHCEEMIGAGRVEVDGQTVRRFGARVDPEHQIIRVDGKRIPSRQDIVYLAFNKPPKVLTAMSDDRGRKTITDFLGDRAERLFHVGRLDYDTEGLMLLTNDGELAHRLAHPSYEVAKTYWAEVPGPVPRDLGRRLQSGVERYLHDAEFQAEFNLELKTWVGRPTALSHASTLSKRWGAHVWLKREDLAHTGAHKINNAVGQTLLAKRLGAKRLIAETGAGQHGVASAAAAARLGIPCVVYMGAVDVERQAPNVGRMQLLGATVVPVTGGDATLRAAIDEALRDWVSDPDGTYYSLGSAVGPHPYPYLVRELQAVIGREARAQMLEQAGGLPDVAVACVGGGSNAIGLFYPFLGDTGVKLIGVEAGGRGAGLGDNAASLTFGTPGVLQGSYTLILQDAYGQVRETHSVSAGLDYSGVGPEHAYLMKSGRVAYESATDDEALDALAECAKFEGILPAIESAHAFSGARRYAAAHPGARILIGCSGRGDKDMPILQRTLLRDLGA